MRKDEIQRQVDAVRAQRSELENHIIDEYRAGYIGRREFIRRGAVVGMSLPLVELPRDRVRQRATTEARPGGTPATQEDVSVTPGGTVRSGLQAPASDLNPIVVNNQGALAVLGQSGEYLMYSDKELKAVPRLAESWKPNADGSQWTFKIRQGVKFQDGKPMTAEDVAATFNLQADPDSGGNALSAFTGVLSKGGAQATDESTVVFELDGAERQLPVHRHPRTTTTSSSCPRASTRTSWPKNFMGTGPWKLEKYTPNVGVTYTKNPDYWDTKRQPLPDRNEIKFYEQEEAAILGIQGGEVDVLAQFSPVTGKALLTDPNIEVIELRAAQHRQLHMRTDKEPFNDKRVRQAVALLINRDNIVKGLLEEKSDYGNDSPFAPVYPTTDTSVPQRKQDVEQAKAAAVRGRQEQLQRGAARLERLRDAAVRPARPERPQGRRHHREAQLHGRRQLLRRCRVRQLALARLHVRHHRVRPPRRAERVPRRAAQERRHLELGPLQEQGVRPARRPTTSRRSTSRSSARRRRRSRRCCSTRCRSSSPTSTSTSRRPSPRWPGSTCRPWATSTSTRRARRPERRPTLVEGGVRHRPLPGQALRPRA